MWPCWYVVNRQPLIKALYLCIHDKPHTRANKSNWGVIGWMCVITAAEDGRSASVSVTLALVVIVILSVTQVLCIRWPTAFREQPAHPNRTGWGHVVQIFSTKAGNLIYVTMNPVNTSWCMCCVVILHRVMNYTLDSDIKLRKKRACLLYRLLQLTRR